jgi:parallel beta-helix repeat protein
MVDENTLMNNHGGGISAAISSESILAAAELVMDVGRL